MISQKEFINLVQNKKERQQRYFAKILRIINKMFPPRINWNRNNVADFIYLTICRKSDFDMVLASMYTLSSYSAISPKEIVVVSDGSWTNVSGTNYFSKHGLNVKCLQWNECANFYKESCPSLTKWAHGHIWGKKMAAILFFSETEKVLFSDPDILWYNTPLTGDELKNCKLKLSIDNSHNYDDAFIRNCGFEYLYDTEEPINCGAVFIQGGLNLLSKEALKCIEYEAAHCGKFAEQTVFAIMDIDYNCRWKMEEITSEISDLLQPFSGKTIKYKNMIARHYLWRLKWIYWKDYFKARFHK